MLDFIKNIFSSNRIKTTSFFSFYQNIVRWRNAKVYPSSFNLPEAISFPESFWKDIIKIFKMTNSDGLERAISVWYADGDLMVTSATKGSESSVTTRDSLSIKYIPHPTRRGYYRKEVYVNKRMERREDIFHEKVPKKIDITYLFNMHTHPKHLLDDGSVVYSFFSPQDIRSLIGSGAIITGLVTDKVWFLARSSGTPNHMPYVDTDVLTPEMLKEEMKLGVYCAEFNGKAYKQ